MAANDTTQEHRLPCGRLVEDVFDDLDTGRPNAHNEECEHCRSVVRGLAALEVATEALLRDPAEPPPGVVGRVMNAVRAELRRGDTLPLPAELGPAEISVHAVAAVLRYAADSVPGVWAQRCRIALDPESPDTFDVEMSLSLRYGIGPLEAILDQVRRRVAVAMVGQIGPRAGRIDLTLADVWDEGAR